VQTIQTLWSGARRRIGRGSDRHRVEIDRPIEFFHTLRGVLNRHCQVDEMFGLVTQREGEDPAEMVLASK